MWEKDEQRYNKWGLQLDYNLLSNGDLVDGSGNLLGSAFPYIKDDSKIKQSKKETEPLILKASQKNKPNIIYKKPVKQNPLTLNKKKKVLKNNDSDLEKIIDIMWDGCTRDLNEVEHTLQALKSRGMHKCFIENEAGEFYFIRKDVLKDFVLERLYEEDEYFLGSYKEEYILNSLKKGYDRDSAKKHLQNGDRYLVGQALKSRDMGIERLLINILKENSLEDFAGELFSSYDGLCHICTINGVRYAMFQTN